MWNVNIYIFFGNNTFKSVFFQLFVYVNQSETCHRSPLSCSGIHEYLMHLKKMKFQIESRYRGKWMNPFSLDKMKNVEHDEREKTENFLNFFVCVFRLKYNNKC